MNLLIHRFKQLKLKNYRRNDDIKVISNNNSIKKLYGLLRMLDKEDTWQMCDK